MANNKTGLNYYNVDTDRYMDIRIKRLKKNFRCNGIAVYDYILCEIYRVKGCFLVWDDSTAFDVAEYFGLTESQVREIVKYCSVVGLFDKELLLRGIVTSASIQRRYLDMCNRAKRKEIVIPEECLILPEQSGIIPEECAKITEVCDKVKKSKVKESNSSNEEFPKKAGDNSSPESHSGELSIPGIQPSPLNDEKTSAHNTPPPTPSPRGTGQGVPPGADEQSGIAAHIAEQFGKFWDMYGKKTSPKNKCLLKWKRLSVADREAIFRTLPQYVANTPDKRYRKDPAAYLNQRVWEFDELPDYRSTTAKRLATTENSQGSNEYRPYKQVRY